MGTESDTFRNACATIHYPCTNGDKYIYPCDCSKFLQCDQRYNVLILPCAQGTSWDHVARSCLETNQVVIGADKRCDSGTPWRRCRDVPGNYETAVLKKFCTEVSNGGGIDNGPDGGGGGGNSAAVVGGILGALLVLLIVAIIVYMIVKKKSLTDCFRSVRDIYKSNTRGQQNEPVEEVYDVIDEKQVNTSKPIDNPGYEKQSEPRGIVYNNTASSDPHSSTQNGHRDSDKVPYSTLKPEVYNDIKRSYTTLRAHQEDDLSRSISVNGSDVLVQDNQGYFIGYPSGTVPRQPSPIPTNTGEDLDDGYSLGKAPEPDVTARPISRLPSDYFVLQPSDETHQE